MNGRYFVVKYYYISVILHLKEAYFHLLFIYLLALLYATFEYNITAHYIYKVEKVSIS